jgi:Uma2 family endonuclease
MAVEVERARRLFTVDEYHRMAEAGVFRPDERVELIDGEIVEMSPIGRRHANCVNNLNRLLVTRLGERAIVSPQNPVQISVRSEPQPDLAVLRRREVSYKDEDTTADDVLLLIEVADTSITYDRTVKLRLYATVGIPEYWVVDAAAEEIEVYRSPESGRYRETARLSMDRSVSLLALPDVTLAVPDIFA